MNHVPSISLFVALFLGSCATKPDFPDSPFPHPEERFPSFSNLVAALPVWELELPWRGAYLQRTYPNEFPDGFVEIQGEGAQCGFTTFLLDSALVGVVTHNEEVKEWHGLQILRRVPGGWMDMTSKLFPGTARWRHRPKVAEDLSITTFKEDGSHSERLEWRNGRYVKVSG
jgi:hypothetical protein